MVTGVFFNVSRIKRRILFVKPDEVRESWSGCVGAGFRGSLIVFHIPYVDLQGDACFIGKIAEMRGQKMCLLLFYLDILILCTVSFCLEKSVLLRSSR